MSETTGPQPGIAKKKTYWVWHSKIELAYTKTILLVMISGAVVAQTILRIMILACMVSLVLHMHDFCIDFKR